jgi:hypothetical protein
MLLCLAIGKCVTVPSFQFLKNKVVDKQCCGSGMISSRIPDPAKFHSGSRILLEDKKRVNF